MQFEYDCIGRCRLVCNNCQAFQFNWYDTEKDAIKGLKIK